MNMTPEEYESLMEKRLPKSPMLKNCLLAFLVGGLICTLGQWILNGIRSLGIGAHDAASYTSMVLIALGAILTGLHIYDKIAKFAGAGTIVPITGFANSIVAPAMEFRSEGLVFGVASKMFVIAGPVLVYGITASVIYGLILVIMGV